MLKGASLMFLAAVALAGLRWTGGSCPELVPPRPSDGKWASEEDFGPGDERPNEPTIFMVDSTTAPASNAEQPLPCVEEDCPR